jgi:hypothetical protein
MISKRRSRSQSSYLMPSVLATSARTIVRMIASSANEATRAGPNIAQAQLVVAAMLFWALLGSGQINMRNKVDGWQALVTNPIDEPIDLAA